MGKAKVSVVDDQDQGNEGHVDAPAATPADATQPRQRKAPVRTEPDPEFALGLRVARLLAKSPLEHQKGVVRQLAYRYGMKVVDSVTGV